MTDTAIATTTAPAELDAAAAAARRAFAVTLASTAAERASWLRAAADALDAARDELVALADEETHLGAPRLTGEVARTTAQLRLFADAVLEGSYLEATIDHPDPAAIPPRPDLRRMLRPLGPVGVFGASNFPFAFSVAGGDTASALAAGCPVIVKGHPAHARLSRRTAEIVAAALVAAGAPEGVFGHVEGHETGIALVQHPEIRAVGFTGSLHGGRALFDLAQQRPDPIPFYGELSAVNPVLITAAALEARADELAAGLAGSFTLGAGQFCTNPGVVFVPAGSGFAEQVGAAVAATSAGPVPMLTDGIAAAFADGIARLAGHADVEVIAGDPAQQPGSGAPVVLRTTTAAVLADPGTLFHECFGPSTLVVEYADVADALAAIRAVGGSLTATVHAQPGEDVAPIVEVLAEVAGRVLFAGWPTGVAVSWAQQHGGPWPSTTTIHTSVGVTAMRRFLRPIAFQDAPDAALPPELRDENVLGIPRRVNGVLVLPGQPEPVA
ncbi:NADP-dependent aldehyde dehydrogenase [Agromyces flavus]|uniref:NADP-dependent aldehyde dehydrogenase n=1 Tax=Agromyces flavus TaxID=589382 RepID=A0A1H1VJJ7_9MICO|nr:aldehyde dehydrogenase (NADP(+)) [Agromyces flavus]MCP2365953.1 NADP-dependent aldehyde dehydrogenase [Agromyces flavus]GGI43709.1 aldehyde dehydrogenase [Agromyces flavus]SDS85124.1 NADP-dependent aldehyde dehydrogenase [Agromyces flavus]